MRKFSFLLISICVFVSFSSGYARELSVKEILKAYKKAVDPEKKSRKINTVYIMESMLIHPDEIIGQVETKLDIPKKMKIYTVIPNRKKEIKIYNGRKAWSYSDKTKTIREIKDDGINSLKMQMLLYNPQIDLNKIFRNIEKDPDTINEEGYECYRLMFFSKTNTHNEHNSPPVTIFFDVNTFLPHRMELPGKRDFGGGHIEIIFEDYENIDGIIVPLRKMIRMRDREIERTIDIIEYNVEIKDDEFDKQSLKKIK